MFKIRSKKSILGIDIGSKMTKLIQLRFNGTDHPELERCDLIQTGMLDEEFQGNVKGYLKEHKIGSAMVASSIDDPSMKIRKVELPKMPDPDLVEAIKWNLRDIVDGSIEDFTVDFSRIAEHDDGDITRLELLAFAIKSEVVLDYQSLVEGVGLTPFFVEPAAVSLASTLERCHGEDDTYIAGVSIGHTQSLFYVVGKGIFVFSRPMVGISLQAQQKEPDQFFQKLAIEIQKSIDTFKVNFKMEEINALFLSGGGALLEGIVDYLNKNLGLQTQVLNPFETLSNIEVFNDQPAPLFAQAVSLAYLQP